MKTRPSAATSSSPRARRKGFTLLEVLITVAVLMVGLLAMSSTSVVVNSLRRSASDRARAHAAVQAISQDLLSVARVSSEDPALWAGEILDVYGPDGSPGNELPVTGLDPWTGSDHIASVTIITDETATDSEYGLNLGMPRDLDGDGVASNTDVTSNASLLPAIVEVRWRHAGGEFEVKQVVYLLRF
ncbi:MAG: prepilin-type N-terminal cleavage/methylation domain-containing protein [Planctomycetota bacterium]|jgi:prepilin-type N-terminal cleavage/methylation domain-containing protein